MPKRNRVDEDDSDSESSIDVHVGYHLSAALPTGGSASVQQHEQQQQQQRALNDPRSHPMLQHTYAPAPASATMSSTPTTEELLSWMPVNNGVDHFHASMPLHGENAEFDLPPDATLLDIFLRFLPGDLLVRVFESYPSEHWAYSSGTAHGKVMQGKANLRMIYQYFAIYIRSLALLDSQNGSGNTCMSGLSGLSGYGNVPCGNDGVSDVVNVLKIVRKRGRPSLNRVVEIETKPANGPSSSSSSSSSSSAAAKAPAPSPLVPAVTPLTKGDHTVEREIGSVMDLASHPALQQQPFALKTDSKRPLRNCIKECIDHFVLRLATNNGTLSVGGGENGEGAEGAANPQTTVLPLPRADRLMPGYDMLEKFWSRFHLRESFYDQILSNFQAILVSPGGYLVCNEQLLYFQGHNNTIQMHWNKSSDKHGLHLFTCHCVLRDAYYPHSAHSAQLFYANPKQGRVPNTHEQLLVWLSLYHTFAQRIHTNSFYTQPTSPHNSLSQHPSGSSSEPTHPTQQHPHSTPSHNALKVLIHQTSVCEDEVESLLRAQCVPHITLMHTNRFYKLLNIVAHRCGKLRQRGDVCAVYNERHRELCVAYWDGDSLVGKRSYVSNLFDKQSVVSANNGVVGVPSLAQQQSLSLSQQQAQQQVQQQVQAQQQSLSHGGPGPHTPMGALESLNTQVSSLLRLFGNAFAEEMHDRKICHKTGGKSKLGQDGQEHKLIMGCVLHNTFAAYTHVRLTHGVSETLQSFPELCVQLADEIFDYALTLN